MFKKFILSKDDKEKLKLKAQRQVLRGIQELEKTYIIDNPWGLGNIMISKEYLINRFGSIEAAAYALSDKLQASPITDEEYHRMANELEYSVEPICVEDIKYTFHGKYIDHLALAFAKAERMHTTIKRGKENPDYYTKLLKDPKYVEEDKDPIIIFLKENEDGIPYGTIVEGNNRILKMKCDMASELAHTTNQSEIAKIKEKYTIYVKTKNVKDLNLQKRR